MESKSLPLRIRAFGEMIGQERKKSRAAVRKGEVCHFMAYTSTEKRKMNKYKNFFHISDEYTLL